MLENFLVRKNYGYAVSRVIHKMPPWLAMPMLMRMLGIATPFNKQLDATILIWDSNSCEVSIKIKRKLKNHLGALHAGAIATIGEMAAGMLLLRNVNMQEYRLILKELNVVYHKQIRNSCKAVSTIDAGLKKNLVEELRDKKESIIRMQTNILRERDVLASSVRTIWQIKHWDKVKS